MKYEEPMKIWAMKEIKDVVNYELDNARKGQTTKLNFVCPHMFALVTLYFAFWYKKPTTSTRAILLHNVEFVAHTRPRLQKSDSTNK